jgi:DNA-binding GntR family transcriptional regulator
LALQERAADELRSEILLGQMRPGERLSEPELAQRFQTSRSPIREALVQLELEGFVERTATGRVFVRPLDLEEAEQLFLVRATLEGLAARLATGNLTGRQLQQLAENIERMQAAATRQDYLGALGFGAEFHQMVTDACGNRPLQDCLAGFRTRSARYRYVAASQAEFRPERNDEHRRVLDAFRDNDPGAAAAAMMEHIRRSSRETLTALQTHLTATPLSTKPSRRA